MSKANSTSDTYHDEVEQLRRELKQTRDDAKKSERVMITAIRELTRRLNHTHSNMRNLQEKVDVISSKLKR